MFSVWTGHTAEPPAVPQDGAGSEPHAPAEPGTKPSSTPGSKPGRTTQLSVERRPQRMGSACKRPHQQQVATSILPTLLLFFCFFTILMCKILQCLCVCSFFSVYSQQSQYSTQPNGGMYSSSSINLGVSMGNSGASMNPMSGQMSSMNEQVTVTLFKMTFLQLLPSLTLSFLLGQQVNDGSLILEQLAGMDMLPQENDVNSVS